MSLIPKTVPTGAIRFNTDSNKMECWIGDKWMQIAVSSPDLDGGVRGIISGGNSPGASPYAKQDVIQYITMATQGNAQDFGELSNRNVGRDPGGMSNSTRGLFGGGRTSPASARSDIIDYITIATTGNAVDFGNLLADTSFVRGCASHTRAVWGGGQAPGAQNVLQYVEIATTGNAVNFGDLDDGTPFSISVCSDVHGGLG